MSSPILHFGLLIKSAVNPQANKTEKQSTESENVTGKFSSHCSVHK